MLRTKSKIKSISYRVKLCGLCAVFLLQTACGGGSEAEIGIDDIAVAYIKRPTPRDQNGNIAINDLRVPITFTEGGDLFLKPRATTNSIPVNITGRITNGRGDVQGVSVSYDATKLVFSVRLEDLTPNNDDVPSWNLYEYDIPSDTLTQLTSPDITPDDELKDDISPSYLPNGDIIFSSNRQTLSRPLRDGEFRSGYATDEERNNIAFLLHVRNKDTGDITQVSFNVSHDLDPSVLDTGRVLFSRWDHMGGRNSVSLYTMNPEGTDVKTYYGAHSNNTGQNPATNVHFTKAREMDDGKILAILRPFVTSFGGGDLVIIDAKNFADSTQPTWEQQNIATGTAQSVIRQNVNNAVGISLQGRYNAIFPMYDGSNRYLMSWSECRIMRNTQVIPCSFASAAELNDPNVVEATPAFGVYVVDSNVQSLLIRPQNDTIFSEIVMAYPKKIPRIINSSSDIDSSLANNGIGILHISSVYDFEKRFASYGVDLVAETDDKDAVDGMSGIDEDTIINRPLEIANALNTTADERPARFIRIIKNAFITTNPNGNPDDNSFGLNTDQGMREIIGYAPIEPDGSVKIKVPANVPLSLSILDKDGRRISQRHQSWFQVNPGETLECVGCHTHNTDQADNRPHTRTDKENAINQGAPATPYVFPNSTTDLLAEYGETMAEARTRHDENVMKPSTDLIYQDVWTDTANTAANRSADASFTIDYTELTPTPSPASAACGDNYNNTLNSFTYCRIVINYEDHIQPIWEKPRGVSDVDTCTSCHTSNVNTIAAQGTRQLDLTSFASDLVAAHATSYQELFSQDIQRDTDGSVLTEIIQVETLINGLPVDADNDGFNDTEDLVIPLRTAETYDPTMSTLGANASVYFMELMTGKEFDDDITNKPLDTKGHSSMLTASELKLISEWLDIGAQYYNNPVAAP